MKTCPVCKTENIANTGRCFNCSSELVPEPERPAAEFASTDWVGEAGAALTHARNALLIAPAWNENWTAQKEIAIAIRCLETAIASEPRPSPTQ